jgi:hypothetical protein
MSVGCVAPRLETDRLARKFGYLATLRDPTDSEPVMLLARSRR